VETHSGRPEEVCVKDALFVTMKHFFPSFSNWLKMPADPRVKEKIIYPLPFILWTVIMMFMTKFRTPDIGTALTDDAIKYMPEFCSN
jgi:hypothetical protein